MVAGCAVQCLWTAGEDLRNVKCNSVIHTSPANCPPASDTLTANHKHRVRGDRRLLFLYDSVNTNNHAEWGLMSFSQQICFPSNLT